MNNNKIKNLKDNIRYFKDEIDYLENNLVAELEKERDELASIQPSFKYKLFNLDNYGIRNESKRSNVYDDAGYSPKETEESVKDIRLDKKNTLRNNIRICKEKLNCLENELKADLSRNRRSDSNIYDDTETKIGVSPEGIRGKRSGLSIYEEFCNCGYSKCHCSHTEDDRDYAEYDDDEFDDDESHCGSFAIDINIECDDMTNDDKITIESELCDIAKELMFEYLGIEDDLEDDYEKKCECDDCKCSNCGFDDDYCEEDDLDFDELISNILNTVDRKVIFEIVKGFNQ